MGLSIRQILVGYWLDSSQKNKGDLWERFGISKLHGHLGQLCFSIV